MINEKKFLISFDTKEIPVVETDILVIGSGVAGLRSAIEAAKHGNVLVITKDKIDENNTDRAQGGIAVALSEGDTFEKHIEDTLKTGRGLCNKKAVQMLVEEGPVRIKELLDWGIKFDHEKGKLAFTQEAGHHTRRVLHARGDATGAELERILIVEVKRNNNIKVMEHAFVIDLLHNKGVCFGAIVYVEGKGKKIIHAKKTILATGGAGQLYRETTNSKIATGCGVALAYRAGAKIIDMEFVQFHPTTLYIAGASRVLISEAARGEGGILLNKNGVRFMPKYHKEAELAPRDVVSRAIFNENKKSKSSYVYLDLTHLDFEFLKTRFPNIIDLCLSFGIDIQKDFIPVCPTAHYLIGGIKTNIYGETTIKDLYACGETACVGLHGANRLASNSLLEGLVFGFKAGNHAAAQIKDKKFESIPWIVNKVRRNKEEKMDLEDIKKSLRSLMTRCVGIERDKELLLEAKKEINLWSSYVLDNEFTKVEGWELQNMFITARIIQSSAFIREESRGVHYRKDYPKEDNIGWINKHVEHFIGKGANGGVF